MLSCDLIKPPSCDLNDKVKLLSQHCYSLPCQVDWRWVYAMKHNYCVPLNVNSCTNDTGWESRSKSHACNCS
jgi:hypothetical protein